MPGQVWHGQDGPCVFVVAILQHCWQISVKDLVPEIQAIVLCHKRELAGEDSDTGQGAGPKA